MFQNAQTARTVQIVQRLVEIVFKAPNVTMSTECVKTDAIPDIKEKCAKQVLLTGLCYSFEGGMGTLSGKTSLSF